MPGAGSQPSDSRLDAPRSTGSLPWKLTLLLDQQSFDWQKGSATPIEAYLAKGAGLGDNPEVVLNLIYHEVLLRRRLGGEPPTVEEYIKRFPQLAEAIEVQFALDEAIPYDTTIHTDPIVEPLPTTLQVPGYRLEGVLGRGGMGVVYRTTHLALNRSVALKMILDGAHSGPRQAARFRVEAELVARLQHPNIVQIHEIGEHEGRPYLALEYVDGGSLDRALAGTPQPDDRAATLVEKLALAVEHAHERGVVHRDLKPANVLLTAAGEPKITDFGLAKLVAGDSHQTESGALVGTPSYMAPEQVDGTLLAVGPFTDIYALGAILYEVLTGRPPFRAESPVATMLQVRACDVVPPRRLRPNLARDLETICLKSLEKDPRRRYSSAQALADDLRRYLNGQPIVARPVPAWERLWLWTRRQRALAAGIGLSIVATIALLVGGASYNFRLSRLNTRLRSYNVELDSAREIAEQNARDALATITQMLVRLGDERLKGVPESEPVRRELLADALKRLEPLQARNPSDPEIRHEMGKAYLGISAIHESLGEFSSATAQCRFALEVLEPLLRERPLDSHLADTVAGAHMRLARLLNPAEGKEHFLCALALWQPLAEADPVIRGKLASSYYSIAYLKGGFGLEPAVSYCEKGIALLESLTRDDPATHNHNLARALYNLGLGESVSGHVNAAEGHFRRCLQIWASIPPEQRTESDLEGMIACQNGLGTLLQERPAPEAKREVETILRQSVDSCRLLARRHPRLVVHRVELARACSNLGAFFWGTNRLEEAESAYSEALKVQEENVRDFPEDRNQKVLQAHCEQNLADNQGRLKHIDQARRGFDRAVAIIDPLFKETPHDFHVLKCLGVICLNYANLMTNISGPSSALAMQERCVRAFDEAHRLALADIEMLRLLKGARGNLRTTYEQLKRFDEAVAEIDAILTLCEPQERPVYRLFRALTNARAGRYAEASAEALSVEEEAKIDGEMLYNLACVHSLSLKAVVADARLDSKRKAQLAETYSSRAMRLLQWAGRPGQFPKKELLDLLGKDPDIESIRGTDEFKKLMGRLQH
jgi:serine/threonine-protein kinase